MVGERALALSCSTPEQHDSIGHAFDKCVSHMTSMCSCTVIAREYADGPQMAEMAEMGLLTDMYNP